MDKFLNVTLFFCCIFCIFLISFKVYEDRLRENELLKPSFKKNKISHKITFNEKI